MFAAVLDDQSILNDPVNEDILDDMLKYLDIFAEDLFPEPKRGDSIYSTRPEDDLKIGKFVPQNKPTEAFAPLENGARPLKTLLELQPLDGKKGDFGRKVLKDSVPDPVVAEEMTKLKALGVLEAAKKTIDALEGPDDEKKKEMKDIIEGSEIILLGYVPNNKPEAVPEVCQLDKEDWLEKLKQKIIAFDTEKSDNPDDAEKKEGDGEGDAEKKEGDNEIDPVWKSPLGVQAKDLEKDLDILNTIVVGSEDMEPFIIKEIAKTILEKVDELV